MSLPLADRDQQLSTKQIEQLEKQQYRLVGSHSAVKVCHWTKSMINGRGGCYKYKFYGIRSHQCMQMTTSMFCASRCSFCWRGEKAPVSKNWYGKTDEPEFIIKEAVSRHLALLEGFNGSEKANSYMVEKMKDIRHVALSLTGEPITYPLLNEILQQFHQRKVSTFLVTNAQFPEAMKKITNMTQFYISVDAPDKVLLKNIDRPLFKDYYERLLESLDIMATATYRTCIRLTVIKNLNDKNVEGYKELIERGKPGFIEVKGYMHVGASQKFLTKENMPIHDDVIKFAKEIESVLPEYDIVDDHIHSRVVCLMRKGQKRYIDFQKFFQLAINGRAEAKDYSADQMKPN